MYHIIINPASRSGKGILIWQQIEPLLKQQQIEYTAYLSTGIGDVINFVSTVSSQTEDTLHLIILGGDGTMNEALQGLLHPERTIIGYIPTGSSNDLARDMGIPKDPVAALNVILHTGTIHQTDIGVLHCGDVTRRFADACGIGFDAAVCAESVTSKIKKFLNHLGLGKLCYLLIALKQIIAAKKIGCKIYLDDSKEPIKLPRFLFIAGMIHQYEGGGFMFCPNADYHDGLLDICAVGNIAKPVIFYALPTAFSGKHYRYKGIERYHAKKMRICCDAPLWVHTDGEPILRSNDITLTCEKETVSFLY